MLTRLLAVLVRTWKSEDAAENVRGIDLIVPICYATKKDELILATRKNLELAIAEGKRFPYAFLAFGNCAYTFPGSDKAEEGFKKEILAALAAERIVLYISAGSVNNSVEEALAIRREIPFCPKKILVVTGEMHSRSARFIWKRVFPQAEIVIRCISHKYEYQPDHPVNVQRSPWVFFAANIARQILLWILPLRTLAGLHHRASS